MRAGELAERSNAADLKSVSPQGLGGSNPSLSANLGVEAKRFIGNTDSNASKCGFELGVEAGVVHSEGGFECGKCGFELKSQEVR